MPVRIGLGDDGDKEEGGEEEKADAEREPDITLQSEGITSVANPSSPSKGKYTPINPAPHHGTPWGPLRPHGPSLDPMGLSV